jgi:hypothetical protein
MNDFQSITPAMHLANEGKKRCYPLSLQVRDHGLFVLGTGVDGIPLRPRAAERAVRVCNNWFTERSLYSHTYPL